MCTYVKVAGNARAQKVSVVLNNFHGAEPKIAPRLSSEKTDFHRLIAVYLN